MRLIDADALLAEYDRQHEGEPGKARIDDHYIGYLQCFEHWCRRWKRERKWDGEENGKNA